eukprot:TRINITY_DN5917_c0_g1_i1.p1 TRINITY_DN5917_c0_g1~~TRINITY_DN5917_c0_g1_i1.p1  ORF type:complete len:992 (+),score=285.06 TRINITY_DN5917_c0_g1_i1:3-2978(+)
MNNTKDQNPVTSDDEVDEEVDLQFGEDTEKLAWKKSFADKYGSQSINELPGGYVEFLVDLPVEFIENKLMQKWGIGPNSKFIIRLLTSPKVLHLAKNGTIEKFPVRTQVESMLEKLITRLTNNVAENEKEIDYHKVNELVEMGFDPEFAGPALIEVDNNLEKAIEVFNAVSSKVSALNNAKQTYSTHGLYVAIREYIIERLPYMTSFCVICDGVHLDNPNTEQSSVCSRQFCTFRLNSMQLLAPDYYYVPTKVLVPKKEIVSIAAGGRHSVFCTSDGAVYSWGEGTAGQLGNGYEANKESPACIDSAIKFIEVAAGDQHTVGLSAQKNLYVWGAGNEALGFGAPMKFTTPQKLFVNDFFRHISVVGNQNFALSTDDAIWVWGEILGKTFSTPTKLNLPTRFFKVHASLRTPTAVDFFGNIWLWTGRAKGFEKITIVQNPIEKRNSPITFTDAAIYGTTLVAAYGLHVRFFNTDEIKRLKKLSLAVEKHKVDFSATLFSTANHYAVFIDTKNVVHTVGYGKAVLGLGEGTLNAQRLAQLPLYMATQVVAGPAHVLCITRENELFVWGRNHGTVGFSVNKASDDDEDLHIPSHFVKPLFPEEPKVEPKKSPKKPEESAPVDIKKPEEPKPEEPKPEDTAKAAEAWDKVVQDIKHSLQSDSLLTSEAADFVKIEGNTPKPDSPGKSLPWPWKSLQNPNGGFYYYNPMTKAVSMEPPAPIQVEPAVPIPTGKPSGSQPVNIKPAAESPKTTDVKSVGESPKPDFRISSSPKPTNAPEPMHVSQLPEKVPSSSSSGSSSFVAIDGPSKPEISASTIAKMQSSSMSASTKVNFAKLLDMVQRYKDDLEMRFDPSVGLIIDFNHPKILMESLRDNESREELQLSVDVRDKVGNTALMMAITSGEIKTVEHLLKEGADLDLKNFNGQTALDFALSPSTRNKEAMVTTLLYNGALECSPDSLEAIRKICLDALKFFPTFGPVVLNWYNYHLLDTTELNLE